MQHEDCRRSQGIRRIAEKTYMGRAKGGEKAVHVSPGQNGVYISDDKPYAQHKKYDGQYKGHGSQKGKRTHSPPIITARTTIIFST